MAEAYRIVIRHLAEKLIYAVLHEVQDHLGLFDYVHYVVGNLVIEVVMHINDGNVAAVNQLLDLENRIAALQPHRFGFLVESKNNPSVVVVIVCYYNGSSLQFRS